MKIDLCTKHKRHWKNDCPECEREKLQMYGIATMGINMKDMEITKTEMINECRSMADQILSPHSKGKRLFIEIADTLQNSIDPKHFANALKTRAEWWRTSDKADANIATAVYVALSEVAESLKPH